MFLRFNRLFARRRARVIAAAVLSAGLIIGVAAPANAYQPVGVVHTEHVKAGPYDVTVGFSAWPLRAMQSLDFTFAPSAGIKGLSGSLLLNGPGIAADERTTPLVRHPRKLSVWGLDVYAINTPGTYTIGFTIKGPEGTGTGATAPLTVLPQPGPPFALSWAGCSLPFVGVVALIIVGWRRTRAGRAPALG